MIKVERKLYKEVHDTSTPPVNARFTYQSRKLTYRNKEIADEFDHIVPNIPLHVVKLHPKSVRKVLTNFLHITKERDVRLGEHQKDVFVKTTYSNTM